MKRFGIRFRRIGLERKAIDDFELGQTMDTIPECISDDKCSEFDLEKCRETRKSDRLLSVKSFTDESNNSRPLVRYQDGMQECIKYVIGVE
jgi:hypothetical protein